MAEEVVAIFAMHGFYFWGGDWDYPIDYLFRRKATIPTKTISSEDILSEEDKDK